MNAGAGPQSRASRLEDMVEGAFGAFDGGDPKDAEQRAKAVIMIAKALKEVEDYRALIAMPEENAEEPREEFLRRLAGYMDPPEAADLLAQIAAERAAEDQS